jgi:Fe-S oxidoreductase
VSFIEDCAVPLEYLADYTQSLTEVFSKYGSRGTWYAHASVGTLHVRPILDMRRDGATKMRTIAQEASELVRKYKGAFSGEHGDGLCRGEWISWQFGPKITEALAQIKHQFDPSNLFNPGKIVNPPKMDDTSYFRYPPSYTVIPVHPKLDWSAWNVQNNPVTETITAAGTGGDPAQGLAKAIEMCNNNGHCRKFDADVMCPSYRITRNEKDLTRGRANTLRLAMSGQLVMNGNDVPPAHLPLATQAVKEVMDLCVSCKGCKRECPTGVDMAKMKIEFLAQYKERFGHTLRDRLVAHLPRYAPMISKVPGLPLLLNLRNHIPLIAKVQEWLTGITAKRSLPVWQGKHFWNQDDLPFATPQELAKSNKRVVLFADTFNAYFENENLQAALSVLQKSGYMVHVARPSSSTSNPNPFCCGRTYLAAGMVDEAKTRLAALIEHLVPYAQQGIAIVGLEPSCLFTLRDEALSMGLGKSAQVVSEHAQLLEEFLAKEQKAGHFTPRFKESAQPILVHGHCHQKAFAAVSPALELLRLIPNANPQLIESSCCGMAGSFGYEVEHIEASKQMAELSLLPTIRNHPDALVVADGTSCRHQIADGASREAMHIAKVLEKCLI